MKRNHYIADKFTGQNSNDSAETLPIGEFPVLQGGVINKGREFDCDEVGTLSFKTGFSHEPIVIHHWKSNDGYEYVLTWGVESGAGVVNYYDKTSNGSINTTFITDLSPHFPPEFVNYGNEFIIMLAGRDGAWQITSSNGVLTATVVTSLTSSGIPPTHFGRVVNGALYVAQETSIIHSAPGYPLRFVPTKEESDAGVYKADQRLILSSAGVMGETMGYEIWKGFHILWTQYDLFVAAWDGQGTVYATKIEGYGLYGLRGWTVLDDRIRFYSTYKNGSVCAIVLGSAGANGETFSVGQNIQISVIEEPGCEKVSDVLRACPKPTAQKKIIAIDSQADWEGSKIASKTGFDTTTNPGFISLEGAAIITGTTQNTVYELLHAGSYSVSDFFTYSETAGDLDRDGAPGAYPAVTPTPTTHVITTVFGATAMPTGLQSISIRAISDGVNVPVIDKSRETNTIPESTGWVTIEPKEALKNVTSIIVVFVVNIFGRIGTVSRTKTLYIARQYNLGSVYNLTKINLYNTKHLTGTYNNIGSTHTWGIGETEIWGYGASTGTITTAVLKMSGLTASSLADLGTFYIGYQGFNDDGTGGLTGTDPTGVEIGISNDGTNFTGATGAVDVLTAAELLGGYKLSGLAITTNSSGEIWVRARVPVALQAGTGASPIIDRLLFDFYTGTARVSTYPMFTWRHKTILSLLTNSSSTECDRAVVLNENGGASVMDNVKMLAGCTLPDQTLVTAGKTIGKFGEGTDNLIWDGSASTNTPTAKTITTPKLRGINKLFARGIKFGIEKFDTTTITSAITWTPTAEANKFNDDPIAYPDWYLYPFDRNIMHYGKDGYIYLLLPEPTNDTTPRLLLRKMTTAGVVSATTVIENRASDSSYYGACMVPDNTGDNLDIVWQRYGSAITWDIVTAKYNLSAGTLSDVVVIQQTSATKFIYPSVVRTLNDVLYVSYAKSHATDVIYIKKSTDAGATWTAVTNFSPTASVANDYATKIIEHQGKLYIFYQLMGYVGLVNSPIYWREITDDLLGLEKTARNEGTTFYPSSVVSSGDELYLLCANSGDTGAGEGVEVCRLVNGTFVHEKSVHDGGDTVAVSLGDGYLAILYNEGSGADTYYYLTIGKGSTWTTAELIETSGGYPSTVYGICRNDSDIYIFGYYLVDTVGGRTGKITYGDITTAYPLNLYAITDGVDNLIYSHTKPISKLTYIPERGQDLRLAQGNTLQARLKTFGQLKCNGIGIEYDEQEGSL